MKTHMVVGMEKKKNSVRRFGAMIPVVVHMIAQTALRSRMMSRSLSRREQRRLEKDGLGGFGSLSDFPLNSGIKLE